MAVHETGWGPGRVVGVLAVGAVLLGSIGGGLAGASVAAAGGDVPSPPWLLSLPGQERPLGPDDEIDGLLTFEGLGLQHVRGPVGYEQHPPAGGDHAGVWQDCGFYPSQVVSEQAVHSLEHGAVWVTFDPDLPRAQVERLEGLAADNPYLLVSPMAGLPSPVVASAWGVQVPLDDVDDRRLEAFLVRYQQGPQTPEPGAPCSGGTSALPDAPTGA
ncbi:DUF3105 domain-containing protein [Aquipuribacter hungaricus]|uniref:DUF3105 domain-containing protein n=1 Tax=Aquipuribacter hungaricus TaxID=545624 RepID=A0ABV7WE20_9MICO